MPFSHHSHSGQFCPGHAKDTLETVVQTAIAKKMQVFALTEHMPRHDSDRYPEEDGEESILESGLVNQDNYYREAVRMREKYGSQISLPIGFESEFCRPESQQLIEKILADHQYDFYMGSLHHVHSIPIDYDHAFYDRARVKSGGTDELLFQEYFDEHFQMLQALKPPVVGHFDLIRLKCDNPNGSFRHMKGVWQRILRNLDFIASYGGILEINCASLRKGMTEPYPKIEIAREFVSRRGRFCLSDDSHGVEHVALNYHAVVPYMEEAGIKVLCYLGHATSDPAKVFDHRFPRLTVGEIDLESLKLHEFWTASPQSRTD